MRYDDIQNEMQFQQAPKELSHLAGKDQEIHTDIIKARGRENKEPEGGISSSMKGGAR